VHTGCLLATNDAEIGKIGPSPSGCGKVNNRLQGGSKPSPPLLTSAWSFPFEQRRFTLFSSFDGGGLKASRALADCSLSRAQSSRSF
jgi:hypothetical protein